MIRANFMHALSLMSALRSMHLAKRSLLRLSNKSSLKALIKSGLCWFVHKRRMFDRTNSSCTDDSIYSSLLVVTLTTACLKLVTRSAAFVPRCIHGCKGIALRTSSSMVSGVETRITWPWSLGVVSAASSERDKSDVFSAIDVLLGCVFSKPASWLTTSCMYVSHASWASSSVFLRVRSNQKCLNSSVCDIVDEQMVYLRNIRIQQDEISHFVIIYEQRKERDSWQKGKLMFICKNKSYQTVTSIGAWRVINHYIPQTPWVNVRGIMFIFKITLGCVPNIYWLYYVKKCIIFIDISVKIR